MKRLWIFILPLLISCYSFSQESNVLSVNGTEFYLNGQPFEYAGVSFFNAIYNVEFNLSSVVRRNYIRRLRILASMF